MYWKPSDFFLNFSRILAIEILIKRMILAINFEYIFLAIYSKPQKGREGTGSIVLRQAQCNSFLRILSGFCTSEFLLVSLGPDLSAHDILPLKFLTL